MKILLTTLNAKYIHKNLALRWIYQACPYQEDVTLKEFTIKDEEARILEEIMAGSYDVVCFSIYIWNIEQTKELIRQLKERQPNCKVLIGGPEVSYESYELIEEGVDAISIGEGEQSVWEYISMLKISDTYEIEGIYTKTHPNKTYRKVALAYLETLDDPYFMEFDKHDMDLRYLYFETSRGCPYGCEYCLSSCDRNVRMFSERYVMKLLERLSQSKVKQVKLLDRTFNADPKRALRIARYMNEYCPNQIFQFEIVAETLSEDLLVFFEKEADLKRFRFEIGVQSFHQETLEAVGRLQNNARLSEVITRLRNKDVTMHVDLIAGLPYEDYHTFQVSFDTLFSFQTKELQLGILKLLKGTKLKQKHEQYDFVQEAVAPYAVTSTKWLTAQELMDIAHGADAVEKFWNSGKCRYTIQMILKKQWYTSAFSLFVDLGKGLDKLPRPYAPQQLFGVFLDILPQVNRNLLYGILYMDYYGLFKQRPPHIKDGMVDEDTKQRIRQFAIEQGINKDVMYRYASMNYACDQGTLAYQIVIYNAFQALPRRYLINYEVTTLKELNSDEGFNDSDSQCA